MPDQKISQDPESVVIKDTDLFPIVDPTQGTPTLQQRHIKGVNMPKGVVVEIQDGNNTTVDNTDPSKPIINVAITDEVLAGAMVTGILTGGEVTINVDPTKYDIAAGTGVVIDWTNPGLPKRTPVTWTQKLAQIIPDASKQFTVIGINVSGNVVNGGVSFNESGITFTNAQMRGFIVLQTALTLDLINVTGPTSSSTPSYEVQASIVDWIQGHAPLTTGNIYSGNTATTMSKSSGTTAGLFINRDNDTQNPTQRTNGQIITVAAINSYRDGSGGYVAVSPNTTIDTGLYDDGSGTLQAMANNQWAIRRIVFFGAGGDATNITYGQNQYSSLAEAKAAIFTEAPDINPLLNSGAFTTSLIHKTNGDLTNAAEHEFVTISSESIGGGASSIIPPDSITNVELATMITQTIKGRNSGGTGDPEDLSVTVVTAMLNSFTSSLKGLVPASSGGVANFLRADGQFDLPVSEPEILIRQGGNWGIDSNAGNHKVGYLFRELGWSGYSTTDTEDHLVPQNTGPKESSIVEVSNIVSGAGQIIIEETFDILKEGYSCGLYVKVPLVNDVNLSRLVITDNITDAIVVNENLNLVSGQWVLVYSNVFTLAVSDNFTVRLELLNTGEGVGTEFQSTWVGNIGSDPGIQNYHLDSFTVPTKLYINYTDFGAVDHETEIQTYGVGDIINIHENSDTNRFLQIEVTAVSLTDPDFIEYDVNLQSSGLEVRGSQLCVIKFNGVTASSTEFYEELGFYTGGEPSFANIATSLSIDGVVQPQTDSGFGLRAVFQEAEVSDDWAIITTPIITQSDVNKTVNAVRPEQTGAFTISNNSKRFYIPCNFSSDEDVTVTATSIPEGEIVYLKQKGAGLITVIGSGITVIPNQSGVPTSTGTNYVMGLLMVDGEIQLG